MLANVELAVAVAVLSVTRSVSRVCSAEVSGGSVGAVVVGGAVVVVVEDLAAAGALDGFLGDPQAPTAMASAASSPSLAALDMVWTLLRI
jgi:hypothetical protein